MRAEANLKFPLFDGVRGKTHFLNGGSPPNQV
jgi:hypothetical protein